MSLTEKIVHKVIADLYAAGYIGKKMEGRGIKYNINPDLPLRHDTRREVAIGDFLEPLG